MTSRSEQGLLNHRILQKDLRSLRAEISKLYVGECVHRGPLANAGPLKSSAISRRLVKLAYPFLLAACTLQTIKQAPEVTGKFASSPKRLYALYKTNRAPLDWLHAFANVRLSVSMEPEIRLQQS